MSFLDQAIQDATAMLVAMHSLREPLEHAAQLVGDCVTSGHKLLVCGNGGSAADGSDFATEFACRFTRERRPYPALNLSACGSLITAIGNDYGFEHLFARQLRGFAQPGDILVALSTSGNSPNILAALREASKMGLTSIALLGRDGGKARGLATIELVVPSSITARIQEGQKFLLHTLCEMVEGRLSDSSNCMLGH